MPADFSVDQLLMAFDIDLTPLKTKASSAEKIIDDLEARWIAKSRKILQDNAAEKASGTGVAQSQQQVKAAISQVVTETQKAVAATKQQAVAHKGTLDVLRQEILEHQAKKSLIAEETAETVKQTREINKQMAELRKQRLEKLNEGGEGEGSGHGVRGAIGTGIKSVTKGVFGEGLASEVAAGVVAGEGIAAVIPLMTEGLTKLVEMVKEAVEESSKLENVRQHFVSLAEGVGIEMPGALEKLREATHNSVGDLDLLRLGTVYLQSGLHVTAESMAQYTQAVVGLSRGTGHTAKEAVDALYQSLLSGRAYTLAAVTGIQRYSLMLQQTGVSARGAAGGMALTQGMLQQLLIQYKALGEPALTLDDHLKRLTTSFSTMFEEFAAGLAGSSGLNAFGDALDRLSQLFENLSSDMKPTGQLLGSILSLMGELIPHFNTMARESLPGLTSAFGDELPKLEKQVGALQRIAHWVNVIHLGYATLTGDNSMEQEHDVREASMGALSHYVAAGKMAPKRATQLTDMAADTLNTNVQDDPDSMAAFMASAKKLRDQATSLDAGFSNSQVQAVIQAVGDRVHKAKQDFAKLQDSADHIEPDEENNAGKTADVPKPVDQINVEGIRTAASAKLKAQEAAAKAALSQTEADLAAERQVLDTGYATGLVTYEDYLTKRKALTEKDAAAKRQQADDDRKFQIAAENTSFAASSNTRTNLIRQQQAALTAPGDDAKTRIANAMNYDAQIKQTESQLSTHSSNLEAIESNHTAKIYAINKQSSTTLVTDDTKDRADRMAALVVGFQEELSVREKHLKDVEALNKQALADGRITPHQNMAASIQNATDVAEAQQEAARKTLQQGGNPTDPKRIATYQKSVTTSVAEAQASISQVMASETEKQLAYIEHVYGVQQKSIEAQLAFNKQFGHQFDTGHDTTDLLSSAIASTQSQIKAYEAAFEKVDNDPAERYSKSWYQIVDNTQLAFTKLQQYNMELAKASALSTPIGNMFGTLGKGIGNIFPNPGELYTTRSQVTNRGQENFSSTVNRKAQIADIGTALESGGSALSNVAANRLKIQQISNPQKLDPAMQRMVDASTAVGTAITSATDPFVSGTQQLTTQFSSLGDSVVKASFALDNLMTGKPMGGAASVNTNSNGDPVFAMTGTMNNSTVSSVGQSLNFPSSGTSTKPTSPVGAVDAFAAKLAIAVEGITSFVTALTTAKSAVGGAIGGGSAGFSLGSDAKAASSTMDSVSKGLGDSMPLIGAGIGIIMGGIMGEKNAMVQQELDDLKNTYTQMQQAYSSGNATLTTTINNLQILIAEAQQDMASSKKGGSQFQDLINQYNQQLQTYMDQQQALIKQMNDQVAQLKLPNEGADYSTFVSSLQAVITQYEQFAGAASDYTEQLAAQTYLSESLANYQQQWTEQLAQDATTAVQDALQLNQLITQRNQLLQTTAQNERNIMQQGVLQRQQTFAQTKAQKLAETQYQTNLQLEQMNQEIDLQTAKVAAESKVFDLATTRIGLEAQLLQLQEAASNRQMANVQALANIVSLLNAGVSSNGSALSTQNDFIMQLLSGLAGMTPAGGSSIDGLLQQYQQYASSGLGLTGSGI